MKLDHFIRAHMDAILSEWEAFATTLAPAAEQMTALALRDHARQILEAIAVDIETTQNPRQQIAKSQGLAPDEKGNASAASIHGALRQASNFSLLQLSAEFRALRASVLRLWLPQVKEMNEAVADEMVRFNEAIDQALAESVITFSARANHMRELFLAILGHDLRAPLSTMSLAADLLLRGEPAQIQAGEIGARVKRCARLMSAMVVDLIGYTRTELGAGMPVALQQADLGEVCRAAAEDAAAVHPHIRFELDLQGSLGGRFDAVRLHQLLTNLMVNAGQYGRRASPVLVRAQGDADSVSVAVTNDGAAIPAEALETIFSPLIQLPGADEENQRPSTSLGLGLYVAREIALAHGGSIRVDSSDADGTTFSVTLPRTGVAAAADPAPAPGTVREGV